jgi:hypothetical protein
MKWNSTLYDASHNFVAKYEKEEILVEIQKRLFPTHFNNNVWIADIKD